MFFHGRQTLGQVLSPPRAPSPREQSLSRNQAAAKITEKISHGFGGDNQGVSCGITAIECSESHAVGVAPKYVRGRADAPAAKHCHSSVCRGVVWRASGSVFCWGRGTEGQLGNGVNTDRPRPTLVARLALVCIAEVACGDRHTVRGAVRSWWVPCKLTQGPSTCTSDGGRGGRAGLCVGAERSGTTWAG